jgi:branched-chain amino acid transport system ATP-binding protein
MRSESVVASPKDAVRCVIVNAETEKRALSSLPGSLSLRSISLSFSGIRALSSVSLSVEPGEVLALIGPNGAGKTSLLNCVSGLCRPASGSIHFNDRTGKAADLVVRAPHERASLGIARTFQNLELFRHLSVLENLLLGRHAHMTGGVLRGGLYWLVQEDEEIRHRITVEEIVERLEIENVRREVVSSLPYGLQKRVELGRALAMEPTLLLLDEPMAGMNVEEKQDMARFLMELHEERQIAIVLIEHDLSVVMDLATRVQVLDFGETIAVGPPEAVARDARVLRAYVGEQEPEYES